MTDSEINKAIITAGIAFMFTIVGGGFVGLSFWGVRRWITKVDTASSKAVSTSDCKDCQSETKRDDEEFRQEIRSGFTDVKQDIKDFKKDVTLDIKGVHSRIDLYFAPKSDKVKSAAT